MSKLYWSHDPWDGFEFHSTEEEARSNAQALLDEAIDQGEGFDLSEMARICWGEVRERVTEVSSEPDPTGTFLCLSKLELRPVGGKA